MNFMKLTGLALRSSATLFSAPAVKTTLPSSMLLARSFCDAVGEGNRVKGRVKWFNDRKGYGFISDPETREDIFVHFSAIQQERDEFRTLTEEEEVEFTKTIDDKGQASAGNVRRSRVFSRDNRGYGGESRFE